MLDNKEEIKRLLGIIGYGLGDNVFFKDLSSARAGSVATFKSGHIIFPRYEYPKLQPGSRPFQGMLQKRVTHQALLDNLSSTIPEPERTVISEGLERSLHTADIIIGASAMNGYHPLAYGVTRGAELFKAANLLVYGSGNQELFERAYASLWDTLTKAADQNSAAEREFKKLAKYLAPPPKNLSMSSFLPSPTAQEALKKHLLKKFDKALRYVRHTTDGQMYNSMECREIVNLILRDYGLDSYGWRVIRTTTSMLWSANTYRKELRVPIQTRMAGEALKRYIIHEFGVHALRSFNGSRHAALPILAHSLPRNARAEEGMAILFESLLDDASPPSGLRRAVERYVAYGLAVGLDGRPRNARELFDVLKQIYLVFLNIGDDAHADPENLSSDIAFSYVDNLFRGTPFTQRGLVYARSKIYLEGLQNMSHYFEDHTDKESFENAFAAKFDPTNRLHLELLKKYDVF